MRCINFYERENSQNYHTLLLGEGNIPKGVVKSVFRTVGSGRDVLCCHCDCEHPNDELRAEMNELAAAWRNYSLNLQSNNPKYCFMDEGVFSEDNNNNFPNAISNQISPVVAYDMGLKILQSFPNLQIKCFLLATDELYEND